MATMKQIRRRLGDEVCRYCISRAYNVELLPPDCIYDHFPHQCDRCGEIHGIVRDLTFSGKKKLLFK